MEKFPKMIEEQHPGHQTTPPTVDLLVMIKIYIVPRDKKKGTLDSNVVPHRSTDKAR